MPVWLSANEALGRLSVKPQTLYAYVSRGRVGVRPDPADPRRSLYASNDVDRLVARKRRGRAAVAAGALSWGDPVVPSAVSTVIDGRLIYRGRDAVALAQSETLESVARLLWGTPSAGEPPGPTPPPPVTGHAATRIMAALARHAAGPGRRDDAPQSLRREAAEVLELVVTALAGPARGPAHLRLARAWRAEGAAPDLIRRALVLTADHELNASTFTARVAASTGASLAASVLAGLCALTGPLHGGMTAQVQAFMAAAQQRGGRAAVLARLAEGGRVPGFGHALYPAGDVRAKALLAGFEPPAIYAEVAEALEGEKGVRPNIDYALAALTATCRLPPDAPFALFAAGRAAGWLAHAIEQHEVGDLIRPRARYTGPALA
jgi:citrate synthase